MRLLVQRDESVALGRGTWMECSGCFAFFLSAEGATPPGARALQAVWDSFVDDGSWTYRPDLPTLSPAEVPRLHYYLDATMGWDTPVALRHVRAQRGRPPSVVTRFSPYHFAAETVARLLELGSGFSVSTGWRYSSRLLGAASVAS